jgi:CelD/BcsL family acetyltransferase involved in cellulose biosynthesis
MSPASESRGAAPGSSPLPIAGEEEVSLTRVALDDPRWRRFVSAHPDAQPSHHPEWTALLADCYGFEPFVLAAIGADGELLAGLPVLEVGGRLRRRAWVSLPFTDYCPPLLAPSVSLQSLTAALQECRRDGGVESIEVRGELFAPAPAPALALRHVLELSEEPGRLFANFHSSSVRARIRRAEHDRAVELRVATDRDELARTFYGLHLQTRRRHGTPVQPRRFFRLLWERMIEPGHGYVVLAYAERRPVAAAVFLRSNGVLLYKYSASDPAAWRLRPNHMIIWDAIQRACAETARWFDFGRTELGHESLAAFKRSWGASERELSYARLTQAGVAGAPIERHPRLETALRRSPAILCRVTGELLYRYAA